MLSGSGKMPALDAANRASLRAAAVAHRDMKRGLNSLATIASIAPWIGLFGTILGIYSSFPGITGDKTTNMSITLGFLSQALVSAAFGLAVALTAIGCYKHLLAEVEALASDMNSASLQLANDLSRLSISN